MVQLNPTGSHFETDYFLGFVKILGILMGIIRIGLGPSVELIVVFI